MKINYMTYSNMVELIETLKNSRNPFDILYDYFGSKSEYFTCSQGTLSKLLHEDIVDFNPPDKYKFTDNTVINTNISNNTMVLAVVGTTKLMVDSNGCCFTFNEMDMNY